MKFRVQMKDPDTLDDCIAIAVNDSMRGMVLEDEESDAIGEVRKKSFKSVASRWFRFGEYLTVEIDTEAGTCTVLEA